MLLRFGIANHRSIRDYREIYLSASKRIKREGLTLPVHVLQEAAVPIVAIYGPNASGKSNLLNALYQLQWQVAYSHTQLGATDPIPYYPFALDNFENKPTRLDCTFFPRQAVSGDPEAVYEYGFEYTARAFQKEWLYRIVKKERQSTQVLFERHTDDEQTNVEFGGQLRGENKTISRLTRSNSLFLSAAAQNNHPQLTSIYNYFSSLWTIILKNPIMNDLVLASRLHNYEHIERLLSLVRQADLGISDIVVKEQEPDEKRIRFVEDVLGVVSKHLEGSGGSETFGQSAIEELRQSKQLHFMHRSSNKEDRAFRYGMESKGTQVLISLLIPTLDALANGAMLVIDELDTSLHPNLSRALVSLFGKKEANPYGAQLVFTTHDVTLLGSGLIQHDEMWIAEKNEQGASRFIPLTDFKLRSRENIERAYRRGRLGGVSVSDDFFY